MTDHVAEIVRTNRLGYRDLLAQKVPPGVIEMLRIPGFGTKRIRQAHEELGVTSIAELKAACDDGRLAALKGFGPKSAAKVRKAIEFLATAGHRVLFPVAFGLADSLRLHLAKHPGVRRVEVCGSVRRRAPTCKDVDLLVASDDADPVMDHFA